ncbi:MAG: transglycosylase domain-containing protein [Planctomycetes bacterium]|nr:transglycosylase domain-containing protein [Planctomycetota bacterium]
MNRRPRWRRLARRTLLLLLGSALLALVAERALDWVWPYPLTRLRALELSTVVHAADGTWLRVVPTAAGERALPLEWQDAPPLLRAAILAAEDERFLAHGGVDWAAILRAGVSNLQAGRIVSGASTLTMQVVRIVEPRPRTFFAKFVEVLRARQLERTLDKEAIASVWLQQVPLGGTLRGFAAAARYWFGRPVEELAAHEIAALLAMVPAPSLRSPLRRPALLRERRDALLLRMAELGSLTVDEATTARRQPLGMRVHAWPWLAPQLADLAVAELRGQRPAVCATAADLGLEERLRSVLRSADLPGDGVAVVVLDRERGVVQALVGGLEERAPLDASRRRRCVGSTLKPFLYALARDCGACSEEGLIEDVPLAVGDWQPSNFHRGHAGTMQAADALATSNNIAAVRYLQRVGEIAFRDLLVGLGLPPVAAGHDMTAILGTGAASPLELARAWQRFVAVPQQVGLSRASVDWTLRALQRLPMRRGQRGGGMAWKSGTSSGRRDAWCVGIDDTHVVVLWLGNLDGRGNSDLVGARTAADWLGRLAAVL